MSSMIPPPPGPPPAYSVLPTTPPKRRNGLVVGLLVALVAAVLVLAGATFAPQHTVVAALPAPAVTTTVTVPPPSVTPTPTPMPSATPTPSAVPSVQPSSDDTIVQGIAGMVNSFASTAPKPKPKPKPKPPVQPPVQHVVRYPKWYLIGYQASEGLDWTVPSSEVAQICSSSATAPDNPNIYAWDFNTEDEIAGCIDGYHDQKRGFNKLTPEEKALAGAS